MSKTTKITDIQITRVNFIPDVPCWRYRHASTPTWRFYWNLTEGAWLQSQNKKVIMTPDTAILIPPQTPFATGADQKFSHFFVHFSMPLFCKPEKRTIWELKSSDVILPYFFEKLQELSDTQLYWAAHSIVLAALVHLPEDIFSEQDTGKENLFEKAVKILDKDQTFSLSYSELANRCGCSLNTLRRQFYEATGLSIRNWQLNRKMEKAVQLLLHGGRSIKETADMLGFADRYHFSKAFKQYFGISPASFVKSGGIPLP